MWKAEEPMSKKIVESMCEDDTFALGKELGEKCRAGDIILLNGDLGVGKTVFTKGFGKGLGIDEPICSPTFTIMQMSRADCLCIILMYTVLQMSMKWMKSDMRIIFSERVYAL